MKTTLFFGLLICAFAVFAFADDPNAAGKTPADGYTVHVTAKHLVNGHEMGPFHHYCKVITNDPVIVCQIYDSADPNAMMSQVEFIIAKKLTRPTVLWLSGTRTGMIMRWKSPPAMSKSWM